MTAPVTRSDRLFTTCIFCHASLGANQVIEHFPVGRRLAFDAERGRLWVVCPKCERWNLSPFETRWEAIEEAERLYRDTRRRVATDNIALARLPEGLELVRIGRPLRPEFAAWRYGDQFGRRRRRMRVYSLGTVAVVAGVFVGGAAVGVAVGGLSPVLQLGSLWYNYQHPAVRVVGDRGEVLRMSHRDLREARLHMPASGEPELLLRHRRYRAAGAMLSRVGISERPAGGSDKVSLTGELAKRALASLLPAINAVGGRKQEVADAVCVVEQSASMPSLLRTASVADPLPSWVSVARHGSSTTRGTLASYPAAMRLALEMALHEDDERRAMAGELGALYARWEDAERVARIADGDLSPLSA